MIRSVVLTICVFAIMPSLFGQRAPTWIWYPGDFEIWLSNQVQARRTERDVFIPPFWQLYNFNPEVNFSKQFELTEPEEIEVSSEGRCNVTIDGTYVTGGVSKIRLPAGSHRINFQVYNDKTPPALFIQGLTVSSDSSWTTTLIHNNSADNNPGGSPPVYVGTYSNFSSRDMPPSQFKLATRPLDARAIEKRNNEWVVDFGKETFGYLRLNGIKGSGKISFYYGESKEEALSREHCETFDHIVLRENLTDYTSEHSRAFRYVNIVFDSSLTFASVSSLYEYSPVIPRGSFKSSDAQLNNIWNIAAYTLELNNREFFLDGIKRDRWIWSGDAVQSFLMNYYLFFDSDAVKRTTWALRGGDPVNAHLNTILDYSLYWFTGIYDYYLYSGDKEFLKSVYPRMVSLMDFVLKRRNRNGMVEGLPGDWVFLDWAPMSKDGELSAMQLLLVRSLESMSLCANLMNDVTKAAEYKSLSDNLRQQVMRVFWDNERGALIHSRKDGHLDGQITRYANMFAMMFGYLDERQTELVKKNVLVNDSIQKITTPYMRFYELAALAEIGEHKYVMKAMKEYWGGMLEEGATSFWETYDPSEHGAERYAMYGRPFGRSLCHAWGASPLYLLGKYYLGVKPLEPGYARYLVEPQFGGLEWIEGEVPTPSGNIHVYANSRVIKITAPADGKGLLRFRSTKTPVMKGEKFKSAGNGVYEFDILPGRQYVVQFTLPKK